MSQSQCGRSPSQVGYDRRLGGPLPHQLANQTRVHLKADYSFDIYVMRHHDTYAVLSPFRNVIPLYKAGYPRVTHPSAARFIPEGSSSLDLHVLGTPPAFVLSQDQTLNLKVYTFLVEMINLRQLLSWLASSLHTF